MRRRLFSHRLGEGKGSPFLLEKVDGTVLRPKGRTNQEASLSTKKKKMSSLVRFSTGTGAISKEYLGIGKRHSLPVSEDLNWV